MTTRTNRSHTQEELEEKYHEVIQLHLSGEAVMSIVKVSGLSYPTVRKVIDTFRANNGEVPSLNTRGRKSGDGRHLSKAQQAVLLKTLCHERPDSTRLALGQALWSTTTVQQLMQIDCAEDLSRSTVDDYLERWGILPKNPFEVGIRKMPPAFTYWAYSTYPSIEMQAKIENGEVLWFLENEIYGEANTLMTESQNDGDPRHAYNLTLFSVIQGELRHSGWQKLSFIRNGNLSWIERQKPEVISFSRGWLIFNNPDQNERLKIFFEALKKRSEKTKRKIFLFAKEDMTNVLEEVADSFFNNTDKIEIFPLPSYVKSL